jgi:hypothetical protein
MAIDSVDSNASSQFVRHPQQNEIAQSVDYAPGRNGGALTTKVGLNKKTIATGLGTVTVPHAENTGLGIQPDRDSYEPGQIRATGEQVPTTTAVITPAVNLANMNQTSENTKSVQPHLGANIDVKV